MTQTEKNEIQQMIDDAVEKGVVKAVQEVLNDKNLLSQLVEDIGMLNAIEEGMESESIDKNDFRN